MSAILAAIQRSSSNSLVGTWDPVTNRNPNVVLSNNNLTATDPSTSLAGGVQTTNSISSGQAYLEFLSGGPVGNRWVGCGNASTDYSDGHALGNDANSIGLLRDGSLFINGTRIFGVTSTWAPGDIVGMKVDRTAGTVCFNVNGGAFSATYTLPTGAMFAGCNVAFSGTITLQKTPTYPIPTGYNYWGN